jgi:hypothetical protein
MISLVGANSFAINRLYRINYIGRLKPALHSQGNSFICVHKKSAGIGGGVNACAKCAHLGWAGGSDRYHGQQKTPVKLDA